MKSFSLVRSTSPASPPARSGPRAELSALNLAVRQLEAKATALAVPNDRHASVIASEQAAQEAVAGVLAAEQRDIEVWLENGGQEPKPRSQERLFAETALSAATLKANIAREIDRRRETELAAIGGELESAQRKRDAIIGQIVHSEFTQAALRAYAEAALVLNREYAKARTLAEFLLERFPGAGRPMSNNLRELPAAVVVPQFDLPLEGGPVAIHTGEMRRTALADLEGFIGQLLANADAEA